MPMEGLQPPRASTGPPGGAGARASIYLLCLDHVREFNASYNYFAGMSNADIEAYQKDSVTGHRPTWKVGANAWAHGTQHGMGRRQLDAAGASPIRTRSLPGAPPAPASSAAPSSRWS